MKWLVKNARRLLMSFTMAVIMLVVSVGQPAAATIAICRHHSGQITYRQTSAVAYSSTLSTAVTKWNNAAILAQCFDQVNLTEAVSADVNVYFTEPEYEDGVLGWAQLINVNSYGEESPVSVASDAVWHKAVCHVYVSEIAQYAEADELQANILYTTLHEFGHIMGLMHPENTSISESVMWPGLYTLTTPSGYDRSELAEQWSA